MRRRLPAGLIQFFAQNNCGRILFLFMPTAVPHTRTQRPVAPPYARWALGVKGINAFGFLSNIRIASVDYVHTPISLHNAVIWQHGGSLF